MDEIERATLVVTSASVVIVSITSASGATLPRSRTIRAPPSPLAQRTQGDFQRFVVSGCCGRDEGVHRRAVDQCSSVACRAIPRPAGAQPATGAETGCGRGGLPGGEAGRAGGRAKFMRVLVALSRDSPP